MIPALRQIDADMSEDDPFLDGLRLTRVYAEASERERADLERYLRDLRTGRIGGRSPHPRGSG